MPRFHTVVPWSLSALLAAAALPSCGAAAAAEICPTCTRAVGEAEDAAMLQATRPTADEAAEIASSAGDARRSGKEASAAAAAAAGAATCPAKVERVREGATVVVRQQIVTMNDDLEVIHLEAGQKGIVKEVDKKVGALIAFPALAKQLWLQKGDFVKLHLIEKAPPNSALIVVDMQNDFINGTLPVPGAVEIVPTINELLALEGWAFVGFTMDYHPHDHASFAENHPGKGVFSRVGLNYTKDGKLCSEEYAKVYAGSAQASCRADEIAHSLQQTLWPTHCVQGTIGQKIHEDVNVPDSAAFVRKGFTSVVDSYGAFESRIGTQESNLALLLRLAGVKTVYTTGLALDYCVKFTSLQASVEGFDTQVVEDATKAVTQKTGQQALHSLKASNIAMVQATSLTSCA